LGDSFIFKDNGQRLILLDEKNGPIVQLKFPDQVVVRLQLWNLWKPADLKTHIKTYMKDELKGILDFEVLYNNTPINCKIGELNIPSGANLLLTSKVVITSL